MLIQKSLEGKVIEAIRTAMDASGATSVAIDGAWKTSQSGLVRWIESAEVGTPAFLNVAVSCPSWQTFSTPIVDFAVNLSLFVRPELDPQGSILVLASEVVENVLRSWQTSTYQASFTALDLENLSVDGVALGGGESPTLANGICSVTWTLTLSGSYSSTTNN